MIGRLILYPDFARTGTAGTLAPACAHRIAITLAGDATGLTLITVDAHFRVHDQHSTDHVAHQSP